MTPAFMPRPPKRCSDPMSAFVHACRSRASWPSIVLGVWSSGFAHATGVREKSVIAFMKLGRCVPLSLLEPRRFRCVRASCVSAGGVPHRVLAASPHDRLAGVVTRPKPRASPRSRGSASKGRSGAFRGVLRVSTASDSCAQPSQVKCVRACLGAGFALLERRTERTGVAGLEPATYGFGDRS